jgi:hypothetical protein
MNINNKSQKTELAELELLSCPLCGGQISSQKYGEAMENLRSRTEKLYEQRLQDQKSQSEKRIKQLMEEQEKQLVKLGEFYTHQNKVLKDEITTNNNKQLSELKQSYEEILKKQKEHLEVLNKETERSLRTIIQDQRKELDQSIDLQRKSKALGLQEGKVMATKDIEVLKNQLLQKDIQLQRLNTDLEKLKNETIKTQPELVGEAGEINLCSRLENEFKNDIFERPKRGSSSGDIIQHIRINEKTLQTPIVYDNKESQHITKLDIEKAKRYKAVHKTNYVMIVSKNLPKKECDIGIIGEKEGILLVHPSIVLELTRQIRKFLVDISREKISQQDRQNKEAQMFTFITSEEVARKLNTLYEAYNKMKDLQTKEQRDHQNLWKTKDIIMEHLLGIYIEITGGIDSIVEGKKS